MHSQAASSPLRGWLERLPWRLYIKDVVGDEAGVALLPRAGGGGGGGGVTGSCSYLRMFYSST